MPKNKPTKGLLKRIRFTKSGKVKFRRAFGRHRRSHKSGKLRRSYRRPAYAKGCDVRRVRALLWARVVSGELQAKSESTEVEAEVRTEVRTQRGASTESSP